VIAGANSADHYDQSNDRGTAHSGTKSRFDWNVGCPVTLEVHLLSCFMHFKSPFISIHRSVTMRIRLNLIWLLLTGNVLRNKILKHWHKDTWHPVFHTEKGWKGGEPERMIRFCLKVLMKNHAKKKTDMDRWSQRRTDGLINDRGKLKRIGRTHKQTRRYKAFFVSLISLGVCKIQKENIHLIMIYLCELMIFSEDHYLRTII
jgi:hypothetical protein